MSSRDLLKHSRRAYGMAARYLVGESSLTAALRCRTATTRRLTVRGLATEAVSAPNETANPSPAPAVEEVSTFLLLSRLPVVQPDVTPLEKAYHAYNYKIQRALSQKFPNEVYFRRGSTAEGTFKGYDQQRTKQIKSDLSVEHSASGVALSPTIAVSALEEQPLVSRRTAADESNDVTSLERSLDRTLFLVVKGAQAGKEWTLPKATVAKSGGMTLHKAAWQPVFEMLGKTMDFWNVSNQPVAVIGRNGPANARGYVMRAHILAGGPSSIAKGVEFAWYSREELQEKLSKNMYSELEDLLSK